MYLELSFLAATLITYDKFRTTLNRKKDSLICTLINTVSIDLVL